MRYVSRCAFPRDAWQPQEVQPAERCRVMAAHLASGSAAAMVNRWPDCRCCRTAPCAPLRACSVHVLLGPRSTWFAGLKACLLRSGRFSRDCTDSCTALVHLCRPSDLHCTVFCWEGPAHICWTTALTPGRSQHGRRRETGTVRQRRRRSGTCGCGTDPRCARLCSSVHPDMPFPLFSASGGRRLPAVSAPGSPAHSSTRGHVLGTPDRHERRQRLLLPGQLPQQQRLHHAALPPGAAHRRLPPHAGTGLQVRPAAAPAAPALAASLLPTHHPNREAGRPSSLSLTPSAGPPPTTTPPPHTHDHPSLAAGKRTLAPAPTEPLTSHLSRSPRCTPCHTAGGPSVRPWTASTCAAGTCPATCSRIGTPPSSTAAGTASTHSSCSSTLAWCGLRLGGRLAGRPGNRMAMCQRRRPPGPGPAHLQSCASVPASRQYASRLSFLPPPPTSPPSLPPALRPASHLSLLPSPPPAAHPAPPSLPLRAVCGLCGAVRQPAPHLHLQLTKLLARPLVQRAHLQHHRCGPPGRREASAAGCSALQGSGERLGGRLQAGVDAAPPRLFHSIPGWLPVRAHPLQDMAPRRPTRTATCSSWASWRRCWSACSCRARCWAWSLPASPTPQAAPPRSGSGGGAGLRLWACARCLGSRPAGHAACCPPPASPPAAAALQCPLPSRPQNTAHSHASFREPTLLSSCCSKVLSMWVGEDGVYRLTFRVANMRRHQV